MKPRDWIIILGAAAIALIAFIPGFYFLTIGEPLLGLACLSFGAATEVGGYALVMGLWKKDLKHDN